MSDGWRAQNEPNRPRDTVSVVHLAILEHVVVVVVPGRRTMVMVHRLCAAPYPRFSGTLSPRGRVAKARVEPLVPLGDHIDDPVLVFAS